MFSRRSRFTQLLISLPVVCATSASDAQTQAPATTLPTSPQQAKGQVAPAKPLAESLTGPSKEEYDNARQLIGVGDYENALIKFRRAHELSKDHRLLWNIAVCENKLRHYTKAQAVLRQYRDDGADKLSLDELEQLRALDETLSKFITSVQIQVHEPDVTVFVDELDVGKTPLDKPIRVDVGKRVFRFAKPGFKPLTIEQTMVGGTSTTIAAQVEKEVHEGKIIVDAGPRDTIFLDGKVRSVGHFEGVVAGGGHTLRVTAPGMLPFQTEVFVKDNDVRRIPVTLHPATNPVNLAKWGWIAGGTALVVGTFIAGALMFTPSNATNVEGTLGTYPLAFGGRR